jgi:exodeoxyribonuclease V alpha subunit
MTAAAVDPFSPHRAAAARGLLRSFCDADVLASADAHTASTLGDLAGGQDDAVLLAVALAVRAVRLGHVYVDLASVAATVLTEDDVEADHDLAALAWPAVPGWLAVISSSPLVAVGPDGPADRPLRLMGTHLYLDRYWRHERRIIDELLSRAAADRPTVDAAVLGEGISRLLDDGSLQAVGARTAVERRLAVIAGGPGTGKTTTVARIIALLLEQADAAGTARPRIALAAPTGKAAARLAEAVHAEAAGLDTTPEIRAALGSLTASTLHRLLGWRPDSKSRFRHDATNQLPHTVVVVDEMSMVPLAMMSLLLAAVRPSAQLLLVGDPRQLASVEAGAVLGDIVGPAADADAPASGSALASSVVVLRRVHRFGEAISSVASAIERGDADAAVAALRAGGDEVTWIDLEVSDPEREPAIKPIESMVVETGRRVVASAESGDVAGALDALRSVQVLCAHRRGPAGAAHWRVTIERWLRSAIPGYGLTSRHAGQAIMVTKNDAAIGVFNGDTGVLVDVGSGKLRVAFDRQGEPLLLSPTRLDATEALSAMTIHKAQGSQFGTAVVVLPGPTSRALTRELLYTGVTRAQHRLVVVGSEAAIRAAVARPIARASGIREALWPS